VGPGLGFWCEYVVRWLANNRFFLEAESRIVSGRQRNCYAQNRPMTLSRHLWRVAAIVTIVVDGLASVLLLIGSDGAIFLWPVWLIIGLSLWLAIGELRRK